MNTGAPNREHVQDSPDGKEIDYGASKSVLAIPHKRDGAEPLDSRIFCLLFLIFTNPAFSETASFYSSILGLSHFHLNVIYVKLIFFNCSLFTVLLLLTVKQALDYIDERMLLLITLFIELLAIILLMGLAFSWDQVEAIQYYILLVYLCLGFPFMSCPLGNSIVSKISDPLHSRLFLRFVHFGTIAGRLGPSFILAKASLICYC